MSEATGASVTVEVADRQLVITNPDKIYFPAIAATKLDLIEFYITIGDTVMRVMRNRPVLLQRFPNGSSGSSFFQKRMPDNAPDWLSTTIVSTPNGTTANALVINDLAHLIWAVNLGCLGFHSWPTRASDPEHCDELRIDLDPGPGTTFAMAQETASVLHSLFDEVGTRSYIKTTGNRGLHVYVRLEARWDSIAVRSAAVAIARELARRRPDLITDSWWKEDRGERIFIDFNQNAPHKTVFAPWSVRARDHAPVSCGFQWDELAGIDPNALTIQTVPSRLVTQGDPWADIDDDPQSLEPMLEMVRRDQAAGLPDAPWPPVYPKMAGEPPRVSRSRAKKAQTDRRLEQRPVTAMRLHPLNRAFTWVDCTTEPRLLTVDQVANFDRDGYILVRDVFAAGDIEQLTAAIDPWEAQAEAFLRRQPGGTMFIATADEITFTVHLVERCAEARCFAADPVMAGLCHDLIGNDVRLYWDQAVYKKPEPEREFPWHQDNGYAFLEPQQYLTCWVPLTDATLANGCPWVVPGVHRLGTLHHEPSAVGLQCLIDAPEAVPIEAKVGDVVVFSSLTPHRTGPNTTDRSRKAYIVQYAADGAEVIDGSGTRVRQDRDDRQFAVLTSGQPLSG